MTDMSDESRTAARSAVVVVVSGTRVVELEDGLRLLTDLGVDGVDRFSFVLLGTKPLRLGLRVLGKGSLVDGLMS